MPQLISCVCCSGFVPVAATECPHCGSRPGTKRFSALRSSLLRAIGGGAVAVTLMACYGAPMNRQAVAPMGPGTLCTSGMDQDNDGYCSDADCDDANPYINPAIADQSADGVDQNCDGVDGERAATPMAEDNSGSADDPEAGGGADGDDPKVEGAMPAIATDPQQPAGTP